jgi:hypothetical protein
MPRTFKYFSPVDVTEEVPLSFDLRNALTTGEIITSVVSAISVVTGTDSSYLSRLLDSPTITGTIISQMVGTLQPGVTYGLLMTATTSNNQILTPYSTVSGAPIVF